MNINELSPKQILELIKLGQQAQQRQRDYDGDNLPEEILKDLDESSAKGLKSNIIRFTKDTLQFEGGKWTKSGVINQIFVSDLKKYTMDAHQIVQGKYKDGNKLRIAGRAASEVFNDLKYIKSQQSSNKDAADFDELIKKVRRLTVYAFASGKTLDEDAKELSIRAIKLPTRARYLEDEDDNDKDTAFDQEWVEKIQQARYEESVLQSAVSNKRGGYSTGGYSNGGHRGRGRGRGGNFFKRKIESNRIQCSPEPINKQQSSQPAIGKDHLVSQLDYPMNMPEMDQNTSASVSQNPSNLISVTQQHYNIPTDGIPPGGRLNRFLSVWKNVINQQWPIMVVEQGYQIQWTSPPIAWRTKTLSLPPKDQKEVDLAVEKFKISDCPHINSVLTELS
ncbi:hypothetical protein PHYBLDRAFT_173468 [Phycomyces blakesleeanus NRRL 1555(-)]|uniref:Uncharacterized protein n=1 Tax=Phycomyces blakesleeanus (strain ATCC 8743b / DSM 1359 / FGSC 10004 / NBRC 33097 / NRRL 1555) TaxID=763407 RepID=A0A162N4J7_PHYB8|nr:hypothetical protein PHYBLDRAFT_173468 [Phycomyces blakesleeanus NRRL 1555(-)]OAD68478.1 hypothetical protein PHYBLDRAFT_173468 [Phycomyces blakesleeanus NRRL 1555(-)]|eukprot:XP_018286518.1 hypothetical protein PHYBLDRAFT_173468 [Phycomyces blakesleeanus NRRL 1555(-)]